VISPGTLSATDAAMWIFDGFEMVAAGEPLRRTRREVSALDPGDVLVEVAGCGVCHTDIGYLYDGIKTRGALPLILGHEISGYVVAAGVDCLELLDAAVVVPAVIPCGACGDCEAGRPMICRHQVMPGNDRDGGFARYVVVPGRALCEVPGAPTNPDQPLSARTEVTLRHLAVVADAVSTPWQAIARCELQSGDVAVVIGLGGVGGYAVQIARARGAHVVGIDIDKDRLAAAEAAGATLTLDSAGQSPRDLRRQIKGFAEEIGAPSTRWTLLECSGTAAGQDTAWGLLVHGATLCVVGYAFTKIQIRLSNLMAFDARAIGNWGCDPSLYPDIVCAVLDGHIDLLSNTEIRPLDSAIESLADVRDHRAPKRIVLAPK
jgi:6-hydroxycyclohex-1-ene-1-carbonyl-CoA dehydrogenase